MKGEKLESGTGDVQDWVFDVGKQFINGGAKAFLQSFKANAELAPKLSDNVKGAVSKVAEVTNTALNAVGLNSEKLAFFGHPAEHPLATAYFSQTAYRYGDYVAKLGIFPVSEALEALKNEKFDAETSDALREAMISFFNQTPAVFEFRVQLNTGLDEMPIEDANAQWSEDASPYQTVARLELPVQTAWDEEKTLTSRTFPSPPATRLPRIVRWAPSIGLAWRPIGLLLPNGSARTNRPKPSQRVWRRSPIRTGALQ